MDRKEGDNLIIGYYFFPTRTLAKEVVWDNLRKLHIPSNWKQNSSDLSIEFPNGSMLYFSGCDDTIKRGFNPRFVVFDEWAEVKDPDIWPAVVRPVLAENGGEATFIYTPKGRNHAYKLRMAAEGKKNWAVFTFPVSLTKAISDEELADVRADTPEALYRQEYECEEIDNATGVFRFSKDIVTGTWSQGQVQLGVDLAKTQDWTVITPFNIETFEVGTQIRFNNLDWNIQKARIAAEYFRHGRGKVLLDATGVGSPILDDLRLEGLNVEGFVFTEQSKKELLTHLAILLEQGKIKLPKDEGLLSELDAFSWELSKTGKPKMVSYGTDDRVMSLALAVWGHSQPLKRPQSSGPRYTVNRLTGEPVYRT